MIDLWLALIVAAAAFGGYLVGVWQVISDTHEERESLKRQKNAILKSMNYTRRD